VSDELRAAAKAEYLRMHLRMQGGRGRPWVASVTVSGLARWPGGPCGQVARGCGFCGRALGNGGPGGMGAVCQTCATAIRDEAHPLGMLLRAAWEDALRELFRDEAP